MIGPTSSFDADDRICVACAGGDPFLQDRLDEDYFDDDREEDSDGERANACANCGECVPLYPISALGDILDPVYRRIVSRNAEYPSWIEPGRKSPEEVIQDILEPDDSRISSALAEYLSQKEGYDVIHDGAEAMYENDSEYYSIEIIESSEYEERWDRFENAVKHRGRFFLDEERQFLDEIFGAVLAGELHRGVPPTVILGGDDSEIKQIYRGRTAMSRAEQKAILENPRRELAPPPPGLRAPGRMNAAGNAAFYGASDVTTCVAELAIPFGGIAIVGKFSFLRPVTVLDLRLLSRAGNAVSYLDPALERKVAYVSFMRDLRNRLRAPIFEGTASLDYLPTQMIAEYLAYKYNLDGIMFVSSVVPAAADEARYEDIDEFDENAVGEADIARRTGVNIVLFSHAATVEGSQKPRSRILDVTSPIFFGRNDRPWLYVKILDNSPKPEPLAEPTRPVDGAEDDPALRLIEDSIVFAMPTKIAYEVTAFEPVFSESTGKERSELRNADDDYGIPF